MNSRTPTSGNERPKKKRSLSAPAKDKPLKNRPSFMRAASADGVPPSHRRRNSWLSSLSSKFSSAASGIPQLSVKTVDISEPTMPASSRARKNSIPQQVQKPYEDVSCPLLLPRNSQPGFLQTALRRLSNSGSSGPVPQTTIYEDRVLGQRVLLNVDRNRERCEILGLNANKLRRVAFCVDIEVASCPAYLDEEVKRKEQRNIIKPGEKPSSLDYGERTSVSQMAKSSTIEDGVGESEGLDVSSSFQFTPRPVQDSKSETTGRSKERLAKKEKKRKLAEAHGTVPVEFTRRGSDSLQSISTEGVETEVSPTTDLVRIYRRCCQLRESPILKKISEQLANFSNQTRTSGMIDRLDMSNYYLELPDLITLGDYLAVVPVYELVMENCGLTDEGVRVILAGLLAAKCPSWEIRPTNTRKEGGGYQAGFVERVILKNNANIGKDGWMYICTFIAMCRSLKSIDLSQVPFPQPNVASLKDISTTASIDSTITETSEILGKAIAGRLGGKELKILNIGDCGLNTDQLGNLIDGVIKSGLCRLGLASNNISSSGLRHVVRYIEEGTCEGLDLGGNDIGNQLSVIAEALDEKNALNALSLARCNLTPDSLYNLFPALAKLKNLKYIDLSQNTKLFGSEPSALPIFRRYDFSLTLYGVNCLVDSFSLIIHCCSSPYVPARSISNLKSRYLPRIESLKRINLMSVSLSPEQAIALAEVLPGLPTLVHINMMENELLAGLASSSAENEAEQEEACALYASLMAATRVSKTISCVDIEVPSSESSEIVKALAKQVVVYCLRNLKYGGAVADFDADCGSIEENCVAVPDALIHLVGERGVKAANNLEDQDSSLPDQDYVMSGTGVVKALEICLRNRENDSRELTPPSESLPVIGNKRAKDMSMNLLESARRMRARLQPVVMQKLSAADSTSYQRVLLLDQTLEKIIKRFEDEFPEIRLRFPVACLPLSSHDSTTTDEDLEAQELDIDCEPVISGEYFGSELAGGCHASEVPLTSRVLSEEEGRIHRFGQQVKRDISRPDREDEEHQNSRALHFELLRELFEALDVEVFKIRILTEGVNAIVEDLLKGSTAPFNQLKEKDPKAWAEIIESEEMARWIRLLQK